ncbi:MAG: FAD-dependent oxidoreductase [Burkholderiaceae bacterium]|nr:FAD-dependent oxidoreductase [Burkholderiaceae bacterium]
MAAFGAAHRLVGSPVDVVLYDKASFFGGQTVSFRSPSGFTFDKGPHVSFTKDERIQALLADAVDGRFETVQYKLENHWKGHRLPHPVQTNMHGLPVDVMAKVIDDFARQSLLQTDVRNYEDWLVNAYGRYFAENFPVQYTEKYHTTSPRNLTTDWIGPRMYRPSLEEVLRGALAPATSSVHYITGFRYPSRGGFMSYLEKWARDVAMKLSHEVVRIDTKRALLTFANGVQAHYDALVSSIPLPELVPRIAGAPDDVRAAADRLACSGCVLVNVGVQRPDLTPAHISYYYDRDIVFSRTSSPHLMSPHNAPPGCGAVQAEVYFSKKYLPLAGSPADYVQPVIRDLKRVGLLREDDRIVLEEARLIDYANIIFDHDRPEALRIVHGFLDDIGIRHCGRYGDWAYYWTDDSYRSGEVAAERALGDLR